MKIAESFKEIEIYIDSISLQGNLRLVDDEKCKGIVLFSHGSGSSRLSIRNNHVASLLQEHGYSSLLMDLLTKQEDLIYENRFNIELLTERLLKITKWVRNNKCTKYQPIAYFGASTGAASALNAAAFLGKKVKAIVSRAGRPDLAINNVPYVTAPTLLIAGGFDEVIIELNKNAAKKFTTVCQLKIVEGASHLFSEPGKLDEVAKLTYNWFDKNLKKDDFYDV